MWVKIRQEPEFVDWLADLRPKERAQIVLRIAKIERENYFGDIKVLGAGLAELRWRNGRRVYFARTASNEITLLCGGNKNGQDKDVQKARKILSR